MSFDFTSILFILIAIMALQPLIMGRWYALRRAQAIRAIEKEHGTRVITMIHRQEKRSLFGFSISRHIDLEDAQTVIAANKETPDDIPIDLVIHTPGGLVLAAMQIARAVGPTTRRRMADNNAEYHRLERCSLYPVTLCSSSASARSAWCRFRGAGQLTQDRVDLLFRKLALTHDSRLLFGGRTLA